VNISKLEFLRYVLRYLWRGLKEPKTFLELLRPLSQREKIFYRWWSGGKLTIPAGDQRPIFFRHLTLEQWEKHYLSWRYGDHTAGDYEEFHTGGIHEKWLKERGLPPIPEEVKADMGAQADARRAYIESILSMLGRGRVSRENAERNLGSLDLESLAQMDSRLRDAWERTRALIQAPDKLIRKETHSEKQEPLIASHAAEDSRPEMRETGSSVVSLQTDEVRDN